MEEYNAKLNKYYNYAENNMIILEVEKLCGYSEFVFIYKNSRLVDVCNSIFRHFECSHKENKKIFVKNTMNNQSTCSSSSVPMDVEESRFLLYDSDELFRDFVKNHNEYFRPLYEIPCKVVYKIYLDDGHNICNNECV
jgi:hypothetical protein